MVKGAMRQDLYPELYHVEERHWWHRHKRRIIHQLINQFAKKGQALDVGCGGGKLIVELNSLGWRAEGIDFITAQTKKRGLKIKKVNLQTEKLPYPANRFNLVICLDTLEHIGDDQRLAREMLRVIKPGGALIISVPAYQRLFSYWDKMLGHYRRYNKTSLLKAVPAEAVFISYYFIFLLFPAVMVRIIKAVLKQKQRSDFATDPLPVLTSGFVGIFGKLELLWLKKFSLPFGLSLVGIWKKP